MVAAHGGRAPAKGPFESGGPPALLPPVLLRRSLPSTPGVPPHGRRAGGHAPIQRLTLLGRGPRQWGYADLELLLDPALSLEDAADASGPREQGPPGEAFGDAAAPAPRDRAAVGFSVGGRVRHHRGEHRRRDAARVRGGDDWIGLDR